LTEPNRGNKKSGGGEVEKFSAIHKTGGFSKIRSVGGTKPKTENPPTQFGILKEKVRIIQYVPFLVV